MVLINKRNMVMWTSVQRILNNIDAFWYCHKLPNFPAHACLSLNYPSLCSFYTYLLSPFRDYFFLFILQPVQQFLLQHVPLDTQEASTQEVAYDSSRSVCISSHERQANGLPDMKVTSVHLAILNSGMHVLVSLQLKANSHVQNPRAA